MVFVLCWNTVYFCYDTLKYIMWSAAMRAGAYFIKAMKHWAMTISQPWVSLFFIISLECQGDPLLTKGRSMVITYHCTFTAFYGMITGTHVLIGTVQRVSPELARRTKNPSHLPYSGETKVSKLP